MKFNSISLIFLLIFVFALLLGCASQPVKETKEKTSEESQTNSIPQNQIPAQANSNTSQTEPANPSGNQLGAPPECVGKSESDPNLPESCKTWFSIQKNPPPQNGSQSQQQPGQQTTNTTSTDNATSSPVIPSNHPWQMIHGSYNHNGYANVKGPQHSTLKWKFNLGQVQGNPPNSIAVSSDGVIYVAGGGKITALDKDGREKWSKGYDKIQGPALSEDGNTIYFASQSSVVAISLSGTEKWRFNADREMLFGPTIGPDDVVYQGSWDGYFYALKPDGTLKWKYKTAGAVSYPSSIDNDGIIYLGGGDAHSGPDSNLYAFDPSGALKWKYDTKNTRVGSPAIGFDGLIYVPSAPTLVVLDNNGSLKWKKGPQVSGSLQAMGPPPGSSGTTTSGSKGDVAGIISPAIFSDGTIYLGNSEGIILALDPKTQQIKWTYKTGPDPSDSGFYGIPSFPIVDNEGTVYAGSVDGKMYAIDKNGQLKWSYQTGGRITEAAPAMNADGTLYFTSEDGYIYAVAG